MMIEMTQPFERKYQVGRGIKKSLKSLDISILWAARVHSNSYWGSRAHRAAGKKGQKAVEGKEKLQLVQNSFACVKMRPSSGILSISLLVSQNRGASPLRWIDPPSRAARFIAEVPPSVWNFVDAVQSFFDEDWLVLPHLT